MSLFWVLALLGLVSGLTAGVFTWPGLFYMGVAWPIIPAFAFYALCLWIRFGGKMALYFSLCHFVGGILGMTGLFLWILSFQQ